MTKVEDKVRKKHREFTSLEEETRRELARLHNTPSYLKEVEGTDAKISLCRAEIRFYEMIRGLLEDLLV